MATVLGALLVAVLVVAGVFVFGDKAPADSEKAIPTSAVGDRVETDGGTLHALALGPVVTWDPQRMASSDDVADGRAWCRPSWGRCSSWRWWSRGCSP